MKQNLFSLGMTSRSDVPRYEMNCKIEAMPVIERQDLGTCYRAAAHMAALAGTAVMPPSAQENPPASPAVPVAFQGVNLRPGLN